MVRGATVTQVGGILSRSMGCQVPSPLTHVHLLHNLYVLTLGSRILKYKSYDKWTSDGFKAICKYYYR